MRLDERVLVGGLVAGGLWLVPMLFVAWPVTLVGGAYVVVASVFLAAAYGRERLTRLQELSAWIAPWALLVALWVGILALIDRGVPDEPEGASTSFLVVAAVFLASGCYAAWHLTALAVRQVLAWFEPDDDAGVSG